MRRSPLPALLLLLAPAAGACAESGVLDPRAGDPSTCTTSSCGENDAGPVLCSEALRSADAGSVVWSLDFGRPLAGPVAADSAGNTYFIGTAHAADSHRLTYDVVSVDPCGVLRWQTAPLPVAAPADTAPSALVSGGLLIVEIGNLQAFDLATGAPRWVADVAAFGIDAGLGDVMNDDSGELGPVAATADGNLFLPFTTSEGIYVLQIDAAGAISQLCDVGGNLDGTPLSLIVDAAGHLDVLVNSSLAGAAVVSFDRTGTQLFTNAFNCTQSFIGDLASGTDFVVQQMGLCAVTLQGISGFDDGTQTNGAMVIDAQNNLYFPSNGAFTSDNALGVPRWSQGVSTPPIAGPLLSSTQVFDLGLANDEPFSLAVTALDRGSGNVLWTSPHLGGAQVTVVGNPFPGNAALLVPPGVVVVGVGRLAVGISSGGQLNDDLAPWPTPRGGPDQRGAARGQ